MEEILKDERFSHVFKDPRFRKIPKRVEKIAVDKRFKQMFNDRKFKEKYVMDKRGRPLNLTSSEDLKKLYDMSSESSESEDEDEEETDEEPIESSANQKLLEDDVNKTSVKKKEKSPKEDCNFDITEENDEESEENELLSESSDEEVVGTKNVKLSTKKKVESDESSDDSSDSDEGIEESSDSDTDAESEDDQEFDHHWEELGKDAVETSEITKRLAVCNMDWDRIRAEDIFAAFDSFKPSGGCINSVKIYPSEYGKQRMEEERLKGPPELVEKTLGPEEEDEADTKKGSKYHIEKLRQYQINRLKYFYAVIDCDSPETANSLHEQLNGMEYESSSIVFDIRFIPDDLTFEEIPHSEANQAPDLATYKPKFFVTTALQQVKVNLTWDETDPKRRDVLRKAFTEPADIDRDIKDYLASSSSESDEDIIESTQHEEGDLSRKERMAKYRALLQTLEDKEKEDENEYEMEITWEPGLKAKTQEVVKAKLEKNTLTPFEETLKKIKDSRAKKREEKIISEESESVSSLSDESDDDHVAPKKKSQFFKDKQTPEEKSKLAELALMASDTASIEDLNVRKGKGKRKKLAKAEVEDDEIPDINDPRFSAMYSSPLFSIDPSDSRFQSRKGMSALIQAQQSKRKNTEDLLISDSTNFKRKKKF